MLDARPFGFREYIRSNGFHAVYLLTTVQGSPVKIGISEDPVRRMAAIQSSHYQELRFHRFWWLPGVAVASRIEAAFKQNHTAENIRGEWFDMTPDEAERKIKAGIQLLGIWTLSQSQMEHLFDQWMRKKWDMPEHAPSPLSGRAPRKDEPWNRTADNCQKPYLRKVA